MAVATYRKQARPQQARRFQITNKRNACTSKGWSGLHAHIVAESVHVHISEVRSASGTHTSKPHNMATTATPGHANAAISVAKEFPVHAAIKTKQANGADGKAFLNGKPVVKTATPPANSFVLPAPFGHYLDVLINLYLYPVSPSESHTDGCRQSWA